MTQLTWYKKLRQLNPALRVCQFNNSRHLPGVYYISPAEGVVDVCATDIGWVPPYPEFRNGQLHKSGYRRIVFILLHMKLTTRAKIRKVFPGFFEQRMPRPTGTQVASVHHQWSEMMKEERKRYNILGDARQTPDVQDKTMDKMKQMEIENFNRKQNTALSGDQFVELAEDLDKDMTDEKRERLDRIKFEYDKAAGKTKTIV